MTPAEPEPPIASPITRSPNSKSQATTKETRHSLHVPYLPIASSANGWTLAKAFFPPVQGSGQKARNNPSKRLSKLDSLVAFFFFPYAARRDTASCEKSKHTFTQGLGKMCSNFVPQRGTLASRWGAAGACSKHR